MSHLTPRNSLCFPKAEQSDMSEKNNHVYHRMAESELSAANGSPNVASPA